MLPMTADIADLLRMPAVRSNAAVCADVMTEASIALKAQRAALAAKEARIAELEGLVSELAYRATPLRELVAKARALTPTPKARETEGEVRK